MSERWVMTERKVIQVERKREQHGGVIVVETAPRIYAVGDDVPPGHEGRPYTRRIEEEAPNRMLDTSGAAKRTRRAKA